MSAAIPILHAPIRDIVPHTYVLHKHSQVCTNCGLIHEWAQTYAKTHLRSRTGAGKYVTNLRPLDHLELNLPVEQINAGMRRVPFCQECVDLLDLSGLPSPKPDPVPQPSWVGHSPPKPGSKKHPLRRAHAPSLDDLLDI